MRAKVHRVYFKEPINHHGTEFTGSTSIHEEKMKGVEMSYDSDFDCLFVRSPMLKAMKGDAPKCLVIPMGQIAHMLVDDGVAPVQASSKSVVK